MLPRSKRYRFGIRQKPINALRSTVSYLHGLTTIRDVWRPVKRERRIQTPPRTNGHSLIAR